MKTRTQKQTRITRSFIASLSRSLALATLGTMGLTSLHAAPVAWSPLSNGSLDGVNWLDGTNWDSFAVPAAFDDLTFGVGQYVSPIFLDGNQTAQSLTFSDNYTIGAPGTNDVLTNTSGNVSVNVGNFVQMNARVGGAAGITLNGGGSLYMTHPNSLFSGNITVDNGSTLIHRQEGPGVQYNGLNSAQEFGRFDQVTLGFSPVVRNITLQNGGVYKIINTGNNPEGNYKNIVIGTGGGTLDLAAGYIVQNLDDAGQIGVTTNTFTKAGKGRLIITGNTALSAANPLQGIVNINGGMLSLDSSVSQTVGANTYVRILGIGGTGTTLNINNGGTLLLNGGANFFDVPQVNANNGSIIATQADALIGYAIAGVSANNKLNINGTVQILNRQLFNPQAAQLPRLRSDLTGTGTLEILGGTAAGSTSRLVIERGSGSTFSGTFRLVELNSLEANPRFNAATDVGKVIADGDIEFAGWGSTLDVRDSDPAAANVKDYTTNEITVSTTQAGAVNVIAPVRATAATGTGHLFNFGTLTIGNHRVAIGGNNSYQTGFADTASITGNATIVMNSDNSPLVFSNAAAISEDAAGRSLTLLKGGVGNTAARDVISGGAISLSNLQVSTGTLQLRGASGAITTGFGGAAPIVTVNGSGLTANGNTLPTSGLLHLDNNTGHVVGTTTVFAAGNQTTNDRIADSATLNLRGNSTVRMTSLNNAQSTETIGTTNVFGHGTIDIVKTGAATAPVAFTLNTLTLGTNATANFTGTSLGTAGLNTSRIVIPGTATGFLGSQYHQANEWAKYNNASDSGFEIGVTPFVAGDYTIGTAEGTWGVGQQIKQNGATLPTLSADRIADRFNFQASAGNQPLNLAGFKLTADQGGIISSVNTIGFKDGATAAAPSGTAGVTAGSTAAPASLYVHSNATIEFHAPVVDNTAGGSVTFVKSGPGTVVLSHQGRTVGQGAIAATPFTTATWSSTNTGGWVINDGMLNVHRGQYLGATPTTVTLNGGQLEINEPVSVANDATIIPGWGHNIVVNGNAMVGNDDNGESADANTGDRSLVKLGSLTVNNNSLLALATFSDNDIAFMGGATFNGKATLNIGIGGRSGVNNANIISGAIAGSGFDMVTLGGTAATLVLGGTQTDTVNSTYNGTVTIYAATMRLNKANGFTAITDGTASEDVIINGGSLFWGPGHHGDLSTTNQVGVTTVGAAIAGTNNYGLFGIAPTSPAAIKNAGMNQIADTATITLLTGTLGESDRITNEKFGALIMKNGTFNVGLGTVEIGTATFSGGALGFDRGGTLKIGTASYLPGAFDQSVFTGRPGSPGAYTTLEIGAGGISLTGQNITVGNGFSGNVAGAGGRLRLGGDLTFTGSDLIGGSYGRKGIYVQTGSTFRELGGSHIDLMNGTRDFNIATDSIFTLTPRIINGGITKSGGGALVLEPYERSSFAGPVIVNGGILQAKGDGAFGTSAGGVTINNGGTVKLDSGWTYGDDFTVTGPGSIIPGSGSIREAGALIAESGTNRLNGAFALGGDATLAGGTFLDPSVAPGAGGGAFRIGTLIIASGAGITGTGGMTLSGNGDGMILNGVNTTGGVTKDGAGYWSIGGAGTYPGVTNVNAGILRISNGGALGTTAGNTVINGGSVELSGGINSPEPFTLTGAGPGVQNGAIVNASGANTLSGNIAIAPVAPNATIRSDAGTLTVAGNITGTGGLTLSGPGSGSITGTLDAGAGPGNALTKNGRGTWTIANTATLDGATAVNGGTLVISATGTVLDPGSALNLGGGNLSVFGSAQSVVSTNLLAGHAALAGGAGLSLGTINRTTGATASFGGTVTTASGNTNGILGGYATVGSDWATVNGTNNIVAFSGYAPFATATAADNAILGASTTLLASPTLNSLKVTGGAGIAAGANNIIVNSGGILSTSAYAGITGTGILSGASVGDELVFNTASGTLDVAAPVIGTGAGALTKTGNGTLRLFGTNTFTGTINVNKGTLSVLGSTAQATLGGFAAPRDLNLNGGTFEVVGNDYDLVANTAQLNIGPAGGTIRSTLGSNISINDGNTTGLTPTQYRGTGDVTFTGGGRYTMSGGTPQFLGFTGNTTVDGGILTIGHSNALGGRPEQTITLKSGSAIINNTGFGLGQNGLPNNIVAEGGVEFYALGGNRVYAGDIKLSGTNTIALLERDTLNQERQVYFNGRVSGTGVTLNVFGANNGNPFYLASGSNAISGAINLNANAVMEVRNPGSLGVNTGDVTVNLNGANSRLFLRHFQNADYRANVVVNETAEINSDRLAGFAGGGLQILSINDLTANGDNKILTIGGGNTYHTRVGGTATFNAPTNTILNVTASDLILENGLTFGTPASTLDKRGGFTAILRGPTNHTGKLVIQQGLIHLQDNGTLAGTTAIDLRGGELRVDNSAVVNTNRINDAATVTLGGGVLRLTGVETLGTVTAAAGTTQVINNPIDETVPNPLTLTGFTRAIGSVVQFQSPDVGAGSLAVGQNTFAQTRVGSRIFIPGQADTTQTIPGFVGNNNVDFVQYDGTTVESGFALGVRDMRNPGNVNSPQNYTNDPAETAWNDSIIARLTNGTDTTTVTTTLTANRGLDAIKIETGGTARIREIALGANQLRIEGGGILDVNATTHTFNVTGAGTLTAGPATPGAGTAELFLGGTGVMNINSAIVNNGAQSVALVKTGAGTVNLNSAAANTYNGGTYITAGVLNTTVNSAFGAPTNPITLSGGTLQFNIPSAGAAGTGGPLGGLGNPVNVTANSLIVLDNGTGTNTDTDIALGALTINGPYTLSMRSFDSVDASFTGTHTFSGTPTLDMAQLASGGNGTGFFTIAGPITGTSGFFVSSSGNVNDTTSILQIGGGGSDTAANTYGGKVTILLGSNSEDLRVELNKAAGTNAITGDLEINGGIVRNIAANQIADSSNMVINQGSYDAFGQSETIASVTMKGGNFRTSSLGTGGSTVRVTGDFNATGLDDLTGSVDGVAANSNTTLQIDGVLRLNGYSRGTVGGTASSMILGGLEMTGTTLLENGAGSLVRLNGDLTTFASTNTASLGATSTVGAQVQLTGSRTFTVADGPVAIDLSASTALTDGTSPGSLIKAGPGTLQLQGSATVNAYTGTTTVNEGTVVLFKNPGINAIPAGQLTIGDGVGGAKADKVIVRLSNQIADANEVIVASSGVLDLSTFATSETVASISGAGEVDLGPGSVLTVGGSSTTTLSGSILGSGTLVRSGNGTLILAGINDVLGTTVSGTAKLLVNGSLGGDVTVATGATLGGSGTASGVITVQSGGFLAPGNSAGILSTGSLNAQDGGTLSIEINGSTAGTGYDRVNVTGTVSLLQSTGAILALSGSYVPQGTDIFALIINDGTDAVNGTFAGLSEGASAGFFNGVELFITYAGNGDGGATANDVLLSVPEPGSAALLLGGLAILAGCRRRKQA